MLVKILYIKRINNKKRRDILHYYISSFSFIYQYLNQFSYVQKLNDNKFFSDLMIRNLNTFSLLCTVLEWIFFICINT